MTPCAHSGLRSHTFKDGKVIRCCPSCMQFDDERRKVLNPRLKSRF
jgi:hypothetical protein